MEKQEVINLYWNSKLSLRKTAEKLKTTMGKIEYFMRKNNIPTRPLKRNGFFIAKDGYKRIHNPNHPNSDGRGYIMEHRLIIEEYLGRYLNKEERIHHIDGDKGNNNINNLYLCKNISDHFYMHQKLLQLGYKLIILGLIKFNKEKGNYYYEG